MRHFNRRLVLVGIAFLLFSRIAPAAGGEQPSPHEIQSLRAAIEDLTRSFGPRYARGPEYLRSLASVCQAAKAGQGDAPSRFQRLRQQALLDNPLLAGGRLLVVKRKSRQIKGAFLLWSQEKSRPIRVGNGLDLGLPSNHECNASLDRLGYDNEIALLSPIGPGGNLTTVYRPGDTGYVGEIDLDWDARRLLFTRSDAANWKIWEIGADGRGLRQVSRMPDDVDAMDPCYLPNGKIVFGSTAPVQAVPCWHGLKRVSNLYLMNADGSGVRQICFDQDHDLHPSVLDSGQVIYSRWDYTGISHVFLRELMLMNPDGTGQRAIYGSNSWFPNALYFPRSLPGNPNRLLAVLSGYHGVHRMGQLVVVDTSRGWHEADGLAQRISGRGDPIQPAIRDNLVDADWPKFLHPFPLNDKYFLVACLPTPRSQWGIYLADVFDNLTLVRQEPGYALLEPVPVAARPTPPTLPENVDLASQDALVYLHDVYAGPGLAGVPRGTIRRLRIVAYHFGYPGMAGPDRIGCGGPWEVVRILGTVPVEPDGSAMFHIPAQTPLAFQALDADGRAVQLMRSWFTAQPGEKASCVGCHEGPREVPAAAQTIAARGAPRKVLPWHGPARGFDFAREVQPVLDRHCAGCHDGQQARPDLRREALIADYRGRRVTQMDIDRMPPKMRAETEGFVRFTPSYEALLPYVRRVGIEDDVSLLVPGEYHVRTSELFQLLGKGHQGVQLDEEGWDRLATWIDLNAPCHGTWGEVYPIPEGAHERRMALRRLYGGPVEDPEAVQPVPSSRTASEPKNSAAKTKPVSPAVIAAVPPSAGPPSHFTPQERFLDLGEGLRMRLVRIPAGQFLMGDAAGQPDEGPVTQVAIRRSFWLGACEVTNGQYARFDPAHRSGYYVKRHTRGDDQGLTLSESQQPVLRVSWSEAAGFCRWLSEKTGANCRLPTEAEWEYACRAGGTDPLGFGGLDADFSPWANLADLAFSWPRKQATGGLEHLVLEGRDLADRRFDDRAVASAPVGSYRPNAWGLCDMHGNAAEWTASDYRPYPYRDAPASLASDGKAGKVVRGGSFCDRPARCRSAARLEYPAWQRVFNVGFRVALEEPGGAITKSR